MKNYFDCGDSSKTSPTTDCPNYSTVFENIQESISNFCNVCSAKLVKTDE